MRNGRAQASIEMTVATFLALLLLFAMLKFCLWMFGRLVTRQVSYDASRTQAASVRMTQGSKVVSGDVGWSKVAWTEPQEKLDFFRREAR